MVTSTIRRVGRTVIAGAATTVLATTAAVVMGAPAAHAMTPGWFGQDPHGYLGYSNFCDSWQPCYNTRVHWMVNITYPGGGYNYENFSCVYAQTSRIVDVGYFRSWSDRKSVYPSYVENYPNAC